MMAALYLAALCAVGCAYEGYDTGRLEKKKCACITYFEPKDFTVKKVTKPYPHEKTEE